MIDVRSSFNMRSCSRQRLGQLRAQTVIRTIFQYTDGTAGERLLRQTRLAQAFGELIGVRGIAAIAEEKRKQEAAAAAAQAKPLKPSKPPPKPAPPPA